MLTCSSSSFSASYHNCHQTGPHPNLNCSHHHHQFRTPPIQCSTCSHSPCSLPIQMSHTLLSAGKTKLFMAQHVVLKFLFSSLQLTMKKKKNLWIKIKAINFGLAKSLFREQGTYLDWSCNLKKKDLKRESDDHVDEVDVHPLRVFLFLLLDTLEFAIIKNKHHTWQWWYF